VFAAYGYWIRGKQTYSFFAPNPAESYAYFQIEKVMGWKGTVPEYSPEPALRSYSRTLETGFPSGFSELGDVFSFREAVPGYLKYFAAHSPEKVQGALALDFLMYEAPLPPPYSGLSAGGVKPTAAEEPIARIELPR
jgi:hypothetical protein